MRRRGSVVPTVAALVALACLPGVAGSTTGAGAAVEPGTVAPATGVSQPAADRQFLILAEDGVAAAKRFWWNDTLSWYDARTSPSWDPTKPLARLWDAYPLFEAIDAIAIAVPTPSHLAAVEAFANKAEQYYNPNLKPVGGYDWYIGTTNPHEHTYFDDNGWWEIGFLDAYRATKDPRYLTDAERAFRFIAVAGWDPNGGGVWWETHHLHQTAEPLAAEIYVGLALYQITGQSTYLDTAQQFLDWANANSWNQQLQLYSRSATDPTVLDYVAGMMIGVDLELYEITGDESYLQQAEQLASSSVSYFGPEANWTPAVGVIYLRFILDLYEADGNPRWYWLVYDNAERALANARGTDHLFLRRWNGELFPAPLLQVESATISLFAWLATANTALSTPAPADAGLLPITLTPSTLDFSAASAGGAESEPVTVTNASQSPVDITSVGFGPLGRGDSDATFTESDACSTGAPLPPGGQCTIDVTYTPTGADPASIALTVGSARGQTALPQAEITLDAGGSPSASANAN